MSKFSKEELKALSEIGQTLCVSIYLPTVAGNSLYNTKRLRSLLDRANTELLEAGLPNQKAAKMLAPAYALYDDVAFHADPREGLALFISYDPPTFFWYEDTSAAIRFYEQVILADHFYLTPLLPLLTGDGQFYVLALSQKHVVLLRGTRDSIHPVNVPGLPHSFEEALGDEEFEPQTLSHSGTAQGSVYGGHDPDDDTKERISKFLHGVERAVHRAISESNLPLVIAGLDYLYGIYKPINTYPHLLEQRLVINADELDEKQLHHAAWSLVEPLFDKKRVEALGKYQAAKVGSTASSKLADILAAACYGRVDSLILHHAEPLYGRFDPKTTILEVYKQARPDNADLVDLAAVQTVLHGGAVYYDESLDVLTPISAVFRY